MARTDLRPEQGSAERAGLSRRQRILRSVVVALVLVGFLAVAGVGGPLVGRLSEVQKNDNASFLPASAESTEVSQLARSFAPVEALPYFLVVERPSGLTPADRQAVQDFVQRIPTLPFAGDDHRLGQYLVAPPGQAIPSADGEALMVPVLLDADKASKAVAGTTPLYEGAQAMRTAAQKTLEADGLKVYVTGPAGILADFVDAFSGIDGILLLVALIVVFVILLIVYRSPILPVTVLLSAMLGLSLAALVVFPLAKHGALDVNGQTQGILFILVVGATTDYALLLVARYREELHDHQSKWTAMRAAWRAAVEPIVASGSTVILGLLCLLLSDLGSTRGLGPVGALGIAGALLSALLFLPAVLMLFGRRIFWPLIPHVDHVHSEDSVGRRGIWGRVAGMVGRHPRRTWVTTLVVLLICGAFVPTFRASGTTQAELFRNPVESVTGEHVMAEHHFPGGSGTPVEIVAPADQVDQVASIAKQVDGVEDVSVSGGNDGGSPKVVDGRVLVDATLQSGSDSQASIDAVKQMRTQLDAVGTDVLVGGDTAANLDVRDASKRDLRVIIPAILAVILVVLMLLLRSVLAAILLVVANVVSFAATIGVSALVFNHLFDYPGADPGLPLYAFVFLVALGIDYSIFLMTRVREESGHRGTRPGVLVGLAVTGGVITSAGVVLAATFSALSVIPILFLLQIAFLVAFGVLLDTLVVRSLLVPAVVHEVGSVIWWPSRLDRPKGRHEMGAVGRTAATVGATEGER
jgi:RND superfamily putative drug exporter